MTLTEPEIGAIVATLARAGGLVVTAPVIGDRGVPIRARLLVVLAIGATVGINRPGVEMADAPLVCIVELAVGLLTGLVARFVMLRAAVAGQLIGLSMGLGFAAQYDIRAGESAGTLSSILTVLASLLFLAVGGLEAIVQSAAASPAHVGHIAMLGPELLREGAAAFGHGLELAAPLVLAALIGNIGLALITRAAPAANVFSIALAGILLLGGIVLVATSGALISGLSDVARESTHVLVGGSI